MVMSVQTWDEIHNATKRLFCYHKRADSRNGCHPQRLPFSGIVILE